MALRTQQIIAHESGVADTIDPLAGSYVVERLTDEIEKRAAEYIQKIDDLGGALAAIECGYIQGEIANAAYAYQRAVDKGEQVVVGVNAFHVQEQQHLERLKVDPAVEEQQRRKLAELRARLETAARGDEGLMPILIECVEHQVTLGEICSTLRGVFGEYKPSVII